MTTFIIFLLAVMSLLGWTLAAVHAREKDDAVMALESQQDQPCDALHEVQQEQLQRYIESRVNRIEDKVNTLYRHLNLTYREVPTHGEVVTITSLGAGLVGSNLAKAAPITSAKSTKERSA